VVGHPQQAQRLFERARLEIAAVQDREIAPGRLACLLQVRDLGGDALGFVGLVLALQDAQGLALAVFGPQLLLEQLGVVGDQGVGGGRMRAVER
jgi:hypothetical protein